MMGDCPGVRRILASRQGAAMAATRKIRAMRRERVGMDYKVISADNHILEPRDLFVTRLPKEFRDRAPHVERGADGGDGWTWNDKPPERTLGLEACAGLGIRISGYKWEEILPGNYDGAAHLADM